MKNLFNSSVAEIQIIYHNQVRPADMRKITKSSDAFDILRDIWSDQLEHVEEFYILLLNKANKVLGYKLISQGGISGTVVDPKLVFQTALKANASSMILAHNHPSGNKLPSDADEKITQKCKSAGIFLDITILDHLIVTPDDNYYSFADEGKL